MSATQTPEGVERTSPRASAGLSLALAAYVTWGLFPLFFALLSDVDPLEVVAHRVIWSLAFCVVLVSVAGRRIGGWAQVRALEPRQVLTLALAAALLAVNWVVFVYGVGSGQVVEVSLGYFTNPLVSVLLGVLVLRERLGPAQWVAVGFGAAGVAVLWAEAGRLPWVALAVAFSFGLYGLAKNRVGRTVAAVPGMTVETAALLPVALGYVVWSGYRGGASFGHSPVTTALLIAGGPITAVVLMLFAAGVRRLRLSTVGLLQYVTPSMQLVLGVTVLGESVSGPRLVGFALVWVGLVFLTVHALRHRRPIPVAEPAPVPPGMSFDER